MNRLRITLDFDDFGHFLEELGGRVTRFGAALPRRSVDAAPEAGVFVDIRESGEALIQAYGTVVDPTFAGGEQIVVAFEVLDSASRAVLDSVARARRRAGRQVVLPEVEEALEGGGQLEDVPTREIDSLLEDLFEG